MHSQVNRFSRSVSSHFDQYFKEFGLATSYVEVLLCIKEDGPLLQKEIANSMHLDPSTITRFLKKLKQHGWIEKQKGEGRAKIAIHQSRASDVEELRTLYIEAERELGRMLGEKFTETTLKLLEHGNSLFDKEE
ncbi:MarR family winged helix-turn-helix transcriptional regulator [Rhodohalobacter halophilus]|uniref:MarR family winged helix-turn-helix transcriptional regulator n=1 Tax=Rhodohalobacter halophilus TaxID=1812810 RepID=UPI00083FC0FE|nr:MarR family transcriptional regulator [Rhodohalobacter halophilus]